MDLYPMADPCTGCPPGVREFRTEVDTFIRIRSYSIPPYLTYWIIEDGAGRKYELGNGAEDLPSQVGDFLWVLDRIDDDHGNYLQMTWLLQNGFLYPKEINYTGNTVASPPLAPKNRVQFDYETRYDVTQSNLGYKRELGLRLTRLKTWSDQQVASTYRFRYSSPAASCAPNCPPGSGGGGGGGCPDCGPPIIIEDLPAPTPSDSEGNSGVSLPPGAELPSLLTAIERWDESETTKLPATTFSYLSDINKTWTSPIHDVPVPFIGLGCGGTWDDFGAVIAEVNGDGLPDLIRYRGTDCSNATISEVYINTGGAWSYDPSYALPPGMSIVYHWCGGATLDNGVRVLDINGDGLDDLVRSVPEGHAVWINNGHGWSPDTAGAYSVPIAFTTGPTDDGKDLGVRFGDVNGDGLIDIIQRRDGPNPDAPPEAEGVYLNHPGAGWSLQAGWHVPLPFRAKANSPHDPGTRLVDVNGDGLVDIVQSSIRNGVPQTSYVFLGTGTPDQWGYPWTYAANWSLPEAIVSIDNGSTTTTSTDLGVRFGDVNGDGWIDVIRSYSQSFPPVATHSVYLHTTGEGWQRDATWSGTVPYPFIYLASSDSAEDQGVRLADLDGNGTVDFVQGMQACNDYYQERAISNDVFSNLLSTTSNGIGGTTTLAYISSTSIDNHTLGAPATARSNLSLVLPVLSSITVSDGQTGVGHVLATSYQYRGGYFHYGRREFRGFRYVRTSNPGNNLYTEQFFVQQDPILHPAPLLGAVERQAVRRTLDGAVFSASINLFDQSDQIAPYVHWRRRTDSYLYDWTVNAPLESLGATGAVKHTASESAPTFDGNGLVSAREDRLLGDVTLTGDDLFNTDEMLNSVSWDDWRVGLPKRHYATDTQGGGGMRAMSL